MTQTCCETEAYTCGSAEARKFNSKQRVPGPYTKAWATLRRVLGQTPDAKSRYPLYSTLPQP